MTAAVSIIDYGSGNLLSVARAFEHCGASAALAQDAAAIERAERLVLPGVGAFADGMQGLHERGLVDAILRYAASGRPLLGICLGMQMLASDSAEFGSHGGLNLIPGRVQAIPARDVDGTAQKIPHIGWADLQPPRPGRWAGTLFEATPEGTSVYLVHSFHFVPDQPDQRLADCYYGGHAIAAAVQSDNIIGCQFHPEKSGAAGLALLAAFLRLDGGKAR
ncbi:imidazole glycerol phosphate synthase subunit HisH [Janthinobacterium fluminis]|uniref:Imidazole glycerol phosphate synthase subunit HisH n=1 Tax=Janthinobacterium fluminis TaxID=2987524 RepID=A0ABT5K2H1_9BURK|nr:imidazole glycerol phosphate synthase subunit HisH [Janthinobacterium fluminis]MDC8758880.1 imidazole glycerol phosphate synthase subunit HisH [Janthinobacterium fluminis]